MKGKGPVRRGPIPPTFGAPIPFNRAFPIYGGKTVKTSIVSNCNCPIVATPVSESSEKLIYEVPPSEYEINNVVFKFGVGQTVYALQECNTYEKAIIIAVDNECGTFTVQYEDGCTQVVTENQLKIYFDCTGCNSGVVPIDSYNSFILLQNSLCVDPNFLELKGSVRSGDFT